MNHKKLLYGSCILLIALIGLSFNVSAIQPMTPPVIEMIVPYTGLIGDCQLLVDQLIDDAALCGIKIIPDYMPWIDGLMKLFAGDFDMFYFIGLSGSPDDTMQNIYETLCFHFVWYDYWQYYNPDLVNKIELMYDKYLNGYMEDAIEIFHEIEWIIYQEQPFVTISYNLQITGNLYTRHLFMNCNASGPLADPAIRVALSYLIDRDLYGQLYGEAIGQDVTAISHLFEWSQYHDTSLPDFTYSIGKATKTIVHAGYLPAKAK
jgi:ABC-type transport system substrate-binding protein